MNLFINIDAPSYEKRDITLEDDQNLLESERGV